MRKTSRLVALGVLPLLWLVVGCTDTRPSGPEAATVPSASTPPPWNVATLKAAFLTSASMGTGWKSAGKGPGLKRLPQLCAGEPDDADAPAMPAARVALVGTTKETTFREYERPRMLFQYALEFPDEAAASRTVAELRTTAEKCARKVEVPRKRVGKHLQAAFTSTQTVQELSEFGWVGFSVLIHHKYERKAPGSGDIAVAVLQSRNAVIVVRYATWKAGTATQAATFTAEWRHVTTTVVKRLG